VCAAITFERVERVVCVEWGFFFWIAGDGIRDADVTSSDVCSSDLAARREPGRLKQGTEGGNDRGLRASLGHRDGPQCHTTAGSEIGRASCREREARSAIGGRAEKEDGTSDALCTIRFRQL